MTREVIITATILLSLLHGLIPNHWLPIIAIGRKEQWNIAQVTKVAVWCGAAHAMSTIVIGLLLAVIGLKTHEQWETYFHVVSAVLMVILGSVLIYRHYIHKHFHLHGQVDTHQSRSKIIAALVIIMFLSPCLEIEAYFFMAGSYGWPLVMLLILVYAITTISGIAIWVRLGYMGMMKLNWHRLEHNSGIITGSILVGTGILSFFYN
ncbi:MAG: hypothetical protein KF744_06760 [Taibaiella sp.]|nr:hypothetical protein [Taibaiella sp.]